MNIAPKVTTRSNQKRAQGRPSVPTKKDSNLGRNKKHVGANEKLGKMNSVTTKKEPQVNTGIIGSKQLQSIYNLVGSIDERVPGDGKENHNVTSFTSPQEIGLTKSDDKIINSVMQQVAELNRDKLSEDSMVKVLTAVYLDAKAKLSEKDRSEFKCPAELPSKSAIQQSELPKSSIGDHVTNFQKSNIHGELSCSNLPLSIAERKKIQWEKERAELAALTLQDRSSKPYVDKAIALNTSISSSVVNSVGLPHDQIFMEPGGANVPPALSLMTFGAHEDVERIKREEQRKQWKAELDRQVLEHRMLQEKMKIEEQQKNEALLNQLRLEQLTTQSFPSIHTLSKPIDVSNNVATFPVIGPTAAHPSASHFTSSAFLPATVLVSNPTSGAYISASSVAGIPNPPYINTTANLSTNHMLTTGSGFAATPSTIRPEYNRTRGFTQELYTDSAESAERARLAHEARMENLRQIEEKRRQKEEEKAKRLLEEKLEEERIAREQAQMKALADAELLERRRRKELEQQQLEQLHENLLQARHAARRDKAFEHRNQPRSDMGSVVHPSQVGSSTFNQTIPFSLVNWTQPLPPTEPSILTNAAMAPVTMVPTVQPYSSLIYLPQQVSTVSSSGVQTNCVEDAEVQTEPAKRHSNAKSLVPRARQLGSRHGSGKPSSSESRQTETRGSATKSKGIGQSRVNGATRTNHSITTNSVVRTDADLNREAHTSDSRVTDPGATNRRYNPPSRSTEAVDYSEITRGPASLAGTDVADTDYRKTDYNPKYASEGFVPFHRPQSRQRKSTGFTPPPGLPEPTRRKPVASRKNTNRAAINTESSRPIPTRIPVPSSRPLSNTSEQHRVISNNPDGGRTSSAYFDASSEHVGCGSLELVRTHDVLNPLDSNGVLPVSREPSATIQARMAYLKTSNPAVYGDPSVHTPTTNNRASIPNASTGSPNKRDQKDPLLNPDIVREHPTPRQDNILRHLSQIRKGLKMKQMLYESGNYEDEDD